MRRGILLAFGLIAVITITGILILKPIEKDNNPKSEVMGEIKAVADASADVVFIGPEGESDVITFTGKFSNGTELEYYWDFGDGSKGDGMEVTHAYSNVGQYYVTLTVKDKWGRTDNDTIIIIVNYKETNGGKLFISQTSNHNIPVQDYARAIKVIITWPSGQIVSGTPLNNLLLTVKSTMGNVSYDSSGQPPQNDEYQTREVIVPHQDIASVNYCDFIAEVQCISSTISGVEYTIEIYVSYGKV